MGALIDTSIWIDAFHSKTSAGVRAIATSAINRADALICEPIYLEFFRGIPDREVRKTEIYLATVPMLSTPPSLWRDALPILRTCLRKGNPVNSLNALIAVIALKHGVTIVSFDQDFLILQKHCGIAVEILKRPK